MTEMRAKESTSGGGARHRRRVGSRSLLVAGLLLILAGVALLAWVAWQFWGTNWQSEQRHGDVASSLRSEWRAGETITRTEWGEANALLRVPRFGDDFLVPVIEGASDEALASGVGHLGDTAPGERGNYVLAGHRVTHGEPFAGLLELSVGDLVYVETRDSVFTYRIDTDGEGLRLPFTDTWVLDPAPEHPAGGTEPPPDAGGRLLTLVTCSEIFHTDDRSIVFGHLVERSAKSG